MNGMQEWFESWFDTHYYHILYKHRDEDEAEMFIRNLFTWLNVSKESKVLDLACGKGRHSIYVNSLGYTTTGVDLSPDSIKKAKFSETKNLDFFVHDMREVIADRRFDVVLNLFTSFGYFTTLKENEQVFNAVHEYLNPDGVLVIDFLNLSKVSEEMKSHEVKQVEGIDFHIEKKIAEGFILKDIIFTDEGSDYHYQEKVQALQLNDFEVMLKHANFSIKRLFGNYELDPFTEDSERLIIIAQKN
jgi:SAM-dependent methyltransferase